MTKIKSFEELSCWKESRKFNKYLYEITNYKDFQKDFDLKRQLRRASISVSSNIAEGFERHTDKELIHFLYISKGSAGEIRSQLYLAWDLEYLTKDEFTKLHTIITDISKMISGLIKYLENSNNK